jgi:hypothetical protein
VSLLARQSPAGNRLPPIPLHRRTSEYLVIYAAILATEIGFWVLIAAGLIARYPLRRPTLGATLLALTPLVDLILLTIAMIDIRQGGSADARHALAAIYLGISIAFGPRLVAWADAKFANRFGGTVQPALATYRPTGADRARRERGGWYRHAAAWTIAAAAVSIIHLAGGNRDETEELFAVLVPWFIIVVIDFAWSFSYTVNPRPSGKGEARTR